MQIIYGIDKRLTHWGSPILCWTKLESFIVTLFKVYHPFLTHSLWSTARDKLHFSAKFLMRVDNCVTAFERLLHSNSAVNDDALIRGAGNHCSLVRLSVLLQG